MIEQPQPAKNEEAEQTGLICVQGPLNGRRRAWTGSKQEVFDVLDREKGWIRHKYAYAYIDCRVAEVPSSPVVRVEFYAYAGPSNL